MLFRSSFYFHELDKHDTGITTPLDRNKELIKAKLASGTMPFMGVDWTGMGTGRFRFDLFHFQRDNSEKQYKKDLLVGGFTLPSMWTGKSWDEIRKEFMRDFPKRIRQSEKKQSILAQLAQLAQLFQTQE